MKEFVSVSEAAKITKLSTGHIRQLCINGKLKDVQKLGNAWAIPRTSLETYKPGPQGFAAVWARKKADEATLKSLIEEARQTTPKGDN